MKNSSQLKAGDMRLNHNEALQVRTSLKAGGLLNNHNEALNRTSAARTLSRFSARPRRLQAG